MKVIAFFVKNDDEELTIEDVATKFSVTYWTSQRALDRLVKNEWLLKESVGRTAFYKANPEMIDLLSTKKTPDGSGGRTPLRR